MCTAVTVFLFKNCKFFSSFSLKVYFVFDSLKSCEPEFLVSTPERLLELVTSKAIDISGVSLLVIFFVEYVVHMKNKFPFFTPPVCVFTCDDCFTAF